MEDLPPLPPYPALPMRSEDRLLWNEWAREYAMQAVTLDRERCAKICDDQRPATSAMGPLFNIGFFTGAEVCAAAIRQSK